MKFRVYQVMKRLYIFLILLIPAWACDDDSETTQCISGEVIGYAVCHGVSIIEVDPKFSIGDSLRLFNKKMGNAIQVPGEFTTGRGHFIIRNFNSDDARPDPRALCLAIVIPIEVPAYTVINRSDSGCK
jgi:hypothetical protein